MGSSKCPFYVLACASMAVALKLPHQQGGAGPQPSSDTCEQLSAEINKYDEVHSQRRLAFRQEPVQQAGHYTINNTDVTIARFHEDTRWKDWLEQRGVNISVRRAEGADESIAFLRHLVEDYDRLKDLSVFLHGGAPHDWHSPSNLLELVDMVDAQKLLEMGGYASLNLGHYLDETSAYPMQTQLFSWRMDCDWKEDLWVRQLKAKYHIPAEGAFNHFAGYCCAQFVVHRDTVRKFSQEFYVSLLNRMQTPPIYEHASYKALGRDMEYLWHVIFGGRVVEKRYSAKDFTHS